MNSPLPGISLACGKERLRAAGVFFGLTLVLLGNNPLQAGSSHLSPKEEKWVRSTLDSLSLEEKAAQMIMVAATGYPRNPSSWDARELRDAVRESGVGGVVLMRSEVGTIPVLLNELQATSSLPLLVAMDMERSLSFRVQRGSVDLPNAMAVGATGSQEAARFFGEVTAREARALGIHWAFAPVLDVNNNPDNPVINIRSFGEDPEMVARLGAAFIRGAKEGGLLTTAKHFPGHGDTALDSHLELPTIASGRERLERVELLPFRAAVAAGVDSVMVGHLAVPALDPSGRPATLSPAITLEILRVEMGFQGLIVTDAMDMKGVGSAWIGEATVKAVQAGADVILMPGDLRVAHQALIRGVTEGQIDEPRIDRSVRRLLETKARLGLHEKRLVEWKASEGQVGRPEDVERARRVAEASITVVQNDGDLLPLKAEEPLKLLHLVFPFDLGVPEHELKRRRIPTLSFRLGSEISEEQVEEVVEAASGTTHVLVSATSRKGEISPSMKRLLARLKETGQPLIVASFGAPYLLDSLPELGAYVCAYGTSESSRQAASAALFGEIPVTGRLPVTLSPDLLAGSGFQIPKRAMSLPRARPEVAGFRPGGMDQVDQVLLDFVEQGAFPGGVLAVGHGGKLVHLQPFGRLSYDDHAPAVTEDTLYDLASLTKVLATTTMAMILVDEGRLDLDKRVQDYLPLFQGEGKEKITIRHLLTHSSGLDWWAPLFQELSGSEQYLHHIQAMDLVYEPGTETKYSDLGIILLGEILARVAGQPLDEFVRKRVFGPLGMTNTRYRPGPELKAKIAPTEVDAHRGYLVHGEVHDENAFALGGVAPHAGLFGTAGDLARFAQMLLNGGVYEHHRIVSRETLELFTRQAFVTGSSRALGWDTRSPRGSSSGAYFSPLSFGHTGFTGTSFWVDPERRLFVILLTNRVHPTRENQLIRKARPAVADAVIQALESPELKSTDAVKVGLDRVAAGEIQGLPGKRLGLVVHAASVSSQGQHAIEVFQEQELDVVRLFTPEHGLRSRAAAGEHVESGRDQDSGLPVVSLYGEHRKPQPEDLEGLDALVFDLQGAGVRFYTYVSTLMLCLQAASESDLEMIVLDRPNPLGGDRIEGPQSAPRDVVPESFVNMAPGPLVHGLTLGEMARVVNRGLEKKARLTVVPMKGWTRDMTWRDTGLSWISPSPNLRSPEAALVYPGTALLEATNVSEGRGTETPFLLFGAPWLRPGEPTISAPGFELNATVFTPRTSPAAPDPKFQDQECQGMKVSVVDPKGARAYGLGLALVTALSQLDGFEWRRGGESLIRLLGTPLVLEWLKEGRPVEEILAAHRVDHAAWRESRESLLIYD